MIVSPVVLLLGITGALYLFRDSYNAWRYADWMTFDPSGETSTLSLSRQIELAGRHGGAGRLHWIAPGSVEERRSTVVSFAVGRSQTLVYLDPARGAA